MNNLPDLVRKLYEQHPWDESLQSVLQDYGFDDPGKAWQNLTLLAG